MTTAVLFDLDRTLVTYEPGIPHLFGPALEAHGVDATEDRLSELVGRVITHFEALDGDPFEAAVSDLHTEWGFDATPGAFADALVDAELDAMRVYEPVRETLATLADAVVPIGVVTNGYRPVQRGKLDRAGLSQYVDTLVTPHDVGGFKPDPRMFERARETLPADRYVVVGDSIESDIRPANRLGFTTVLVGDDHPAADHAITDPGEIGKVLDLVDGGAHQPATGNEPPE